MMVAILSQVCLLFVLLVTRINDVSNGWPTRGGAVGRRQGGYAAKKRGGRRFKTRGTRHEEQGRVSDLSCGFSDAGADLEEAREERLLAEAAEGVAVVN